MGDLSGSVLIVIFSVTIVISYFFTVLSKKTGIPSVLMLIFLGILINSALTISGSGSYNFKSPGSNILEVLGVVGLILIVLEAALDLRLKKEKLPLIFKSFFVALLSLAGTSYLGALVLGYFVENMLFSTALLYTIPMSILSSAILLPSVGGLDKDKQEFLIYESTFSDIIGIVSFTIILATSVGSGDAGIYGESFSRLFLTVLFSVISSYFLIYIFQKIQGKTKLFLLIAILVLLYVLGDMLGLTSLLIILIFGIVLNNRDLFFKGRFSVLIDSEKTDSVLDDFKVITAESAFVVRTFFFIIFGWSISLLSLVYNKANGEWTFKVFVIGFFLLLTIYLVRFLVLLVFVRKSVWPQVFLSPRGLLTILLFYAIPTNITPETSFDFEGVLLFIILASCLIMSWALIKNRKKEEKIDIQPVVETKKTPLEDKEGKNDKTSLEDDYNN